MSDSLIKLLLFDDDPIFRLGLSTALTGFNDLRIIAEIDDTTMVLKLLGEQTPDIIILDPDLRLTNGWQLCWQIKQAYPKVKICLLSATQASEELLNLKALGVEGYYPKGIASEVLVKELRSIFRGEIDWQNLKNLKEIPPEIQLKLSRHKQWLVRMRRSGLAQIDTNLNQIKQQLENSQLPWLDSTFWQGRKRELLAARWLVNQLLPESGILIQEKPSQEASQTNSEFNSSRLLKPTDYQEISVIFQSQNRLEIFKHTFNKIQSQLENLTEISLETDILQPEKKQELFNIVLNQLRVILEHLRVLEVTPEQLPENPSRILQEIWQASTLTFIGKYGLPKSNFRLDNLEDLLTQYAPLIQEEILEQIPLVEELFAYLLFQENLVIDKVAYRPESPEALERAELLLQNLITQIANGVMFLILNNFSEIEEIKQVLYNRERISSREIAKFRNYLSWRYRKEKYWDNPQAIFESKYRLFYLNEKGIKTIFIYAPRQAELSQLRGIPWLVTILLETRDAIAPRLRSLVGFLGNGLVYLLTQVIGRGMGLIGRGIIQGIGNSLQDTRKREQ